MSFDFLNSDVSDKEFATRLVSALDGENQMRPTGDFDLNPIQLQKLIDLVGFFRGAAKDLGGKIESIDVDPMNPPSGITASFIVFDLSGDDVQRFCDVIRNCSAISMDVTSDDKVCISCTIPGVFTYRG